MNSEVMTSATVRFINCSYWGTIWLRREDKAFQQIKLGYNADNLRVLFDRIGVEIVALEHVAQNAHGEFARHRLHGVGHMAGNGFFEKFIHGAIPSILVVSALTPSATAT